MSSLATDYSGAGIQGSADAHAALASIADIAIQTFDGFERVTRLNLQTIKTTLAEQHGIALEAVDSRSTAWVVTLPVALAQAGFKKALAYWQHLNAIATETASNNAGAGWEGMSAYTSWFASAYADARRQATVPLVLASPDANLPTSLEESAQTKTSGKKRSMDIVDSSGNVVSSEKQ